MTTRTRAAQPNLLMTPDTGPSVNGNAHVLKQEKASPEPGSGHLHLSITGSRAVFSTLQATYPLKLLAPSPLPSQPPLLAIAYTLAYGGGLVAGDVISLRIEVDDNGGLVLLTQGSTKVFRTRPGIRPLSHARVRATTSKESHALSTNQRMHIKLGSNAFTLVLPDSISPFHQSSYRQSQRFVLPPDGTASVLVLDWVNSGRGSGFGDGQGEVWSVDRYDSVNEILVGKSLIMRERMNLVNHSSSDLAADASLRPVAKRLAPYAVYATVLLYGPHLASLLEYLRKLCDTTTQFQLKEVPGLVWSYSDTSGADGLGGVLRIAGREVEETRVWLRRVFERGGVKELVGEGLWPRMI